MLVTIFKGQCGKRQQASHFPDVRSAYLGIFLDFSRVYCITCSLSGQLPSRLLCIIPCSVNLGFVLLEEILQEIVVQELCTLGLWQHGPKQECKLERVVKRNPVDQEISKDFDNAEKSVHNPVNEPLSVVSLLLRLNSLEGLERWIKKSHNVAKRSSANSKEHENNKHESSNQHEIFLGDLRSILLRLGHLQMLDYKTISKVLRHECSVQTSS